MEEGLVDPLSLAKDADLMKGKEKYWFYENLLENTHLIFFYAFSMQVVKLVILFSLQIKFCFYS